MVTEKVFATLVVAEVGDTEPAVRSGRAATLAELSQENVLEYPPEVTVIEPVLTLRPVPTVVYILTTLVLVPERLLGLPVALGPPLQEYA